MSSGSLLSRSRKCVKNYHWSRITSPGKVDFLLTNNPWIDITMNLIASPSGDVRIRSRWHDDHFIHIEHGKLEAGTVESGWRSAFWTLHPLKNEPFVFIYSCWKDDHFLNVQPEHLQCSLIEPGWQSAQWYLERVKGSRFFRLRNRWLGNFYIHCEEGSLEAGVIDQQWQSAQWAF